MHIGQLAQLAGTTARAVRHYHRVGVLPEPARSANGYRRYEVRDLVRVTRIRWLLRSGLSLREVTAVLDEDASAGMDLVAELRCTLDRVIEEQARLAKQEQDLRKLIAQMETGQRPSALTVDVLNGLNAVADATGPRTQGLLDTERDAIELMANRGLAGEAAQEAIASAYQRVSTDPTLAASLTDLTNRLEAMAGADPATVASDIEIAAEVLQQVLADASIDELLAELRAESNHSTDASENLWLATLFPDAAHQAVITRVLSQSAP